MRGVWRSVRAGLAALPVLRSADRSISVCERNSSSRVSGLMENRPHTGLALAPRDLAEAHAQQHKHAAAQRISVRTAGPSQLDRAAPRRVYGGVVLFPRTCTRPASPARSGARPPARPWRHGRTGRRADSEAKLTQGEGETQCPLQQHSDTRVWVKDRAGPRGPDNVSASAAALISSHCVRLTSATAQRSAVAAPTRPRHAHCLHSAKHLRVALAVRLLPLSLAVRLLGGAELRRSLRRRR